MRRGPSLSGEPAGPLGVSCAVALGGAGLAVLLAFLLRTVGLRDANVWWDEGLAVWAARQPLAAMAAWTSRDVHPPLYFALLHAWLPLAGDSEYAIRFLSVACGVATVAALWKLGRLLVPEQPWVAAAGSLLLASAPFNVWWSQEARMYALGALLVTAHLVFTVMVVRRSTPFACIGYLLTAVAALWTLYLLAFLLVVDGLYWLWALRRLPGWWERLRAFVRWSILLLIPIAAFVPWLRYALPRMQSWSQQTNFSTALFAQLYATLLTLGISTDVDRWLPVVIALLALVGVGLLAQVARRGRSDAGDRDDIVLLLLILLVPPLVVAAVTLLPHGFGYAPSPEARYLLPYAAVFSLLTAWAVFSLVRRFKRAQPLAALALLLPFVVAQGWSLASYYGGRELVDDYRSITETLRAEVQPGDMVVLHTDDAWPVFAYYWPRPFAGTPHLQAATPDGADYFLKPLWTGHDAIWLVVDEDALRDDPQHAYARWLAQRAVASQSWRFGDRQLVLYVRTPARARSAQSLAPGFRPPAPLRVVKGNGLTVMGWDQPLDRLQAGNEATAAVYVERSGRGGTIGLRLGTGPPLQTTISVPAGQGIIRLTGSVAVPANARSGVAPWQMSLGTGWVTVGEVDIFGGKPLTAAAPTVHPQVAVDATLGQPAQARLLGYDLQPPDSANPNLNVTLYWQAMTASPISYKVFVHLDDAAGKVATQRDDFPVQGTRPTTSWLPGEVIQDRYQVPIPATLPSGRYTLTVGMYDPVTGVRLSPVLDASGATQASDQLVLTTMAVAGGQ